MAAVIKTGCSNVMYGSLSQLLIQTQCRSVINPDIGS